MTEIAARASMRLQSAGATRLTSPKSCFHFRKRWQNFGKLSRNDAVACSCRRQEAERTLNANQPPRYLGSYGFVASSTASLRFSRVATAVQKLCGVVAVSCVLFADKGFAAELETTTLPEYLVTATRMPQAPAQTASSVDAVSGDVLAHSPSLALDDTLRSASAAFSLFRRSSSSIANPTAQGVSLRGLGPSGASRTLVLLDGIPLNDPFGGWISWTKIPRLNLQRVEIVRGTGSGVWGNAALGGTVQLLATPDDDSAGVLALEAGELGTVRGEVVSRFRSGEATAWQFGGRWFQTDGPFQYEPPQRGPIDRRFASEHALVHGDVSTRLGSGLRLTLGGRWFDEERGNGTPLQRNRSREHAGHARLSGELRPGLELDILAYAQRQHFASGFSAVDATRTSETPALDQFDVPATAWGGAWVATWRGEANIATAVGADVRAVAGETREDFFFSAGESQRRRFAGGDQIVAGVFASHQRPLSEQFALQLAARLDHWTQRDGHRREWMKSSGVVLRDESFANRHGAEFSPSWGFVFTPSEHLTWRAAAYRAFRVPTLNELYRPFRVGNVATEANAALRRESVIGGELGTEFVQGNWRGRATVFENQLRNGVANVTLASTPALTQRQRLNLESIRVRGFEASVTWSPRPAFAVRLDYLLLDARVERATIAPDLAGRRLAQVPRQTASLLLNWQPQDAWRFDAAARAVSSQFEDDENTLRLASFITVDIALRHALTPRHTVHVAVENLFDARVETARTVAGLVSLGAQRAARVGWTVQW